MHTTGQLIKAKVNNIPFIYHYGIILQEAHETFGLHNSPRQSSVIDTLDTWLETRTVESVQDTNLIGQTNKTIINRFKTECKREYKLFSYNCEHFVDCMVDQELRSEQLRTWGLRIGLLYVTHQLFRGS